MIATGFKLDKSKLYVIVNNQNILLCDESGFVTHFDKIINDCENIIECKKSADMSHNFEITYVHNNQNISWEFMYYENEYIAF